MTDSQNDAESQTVPELPKGKKSASAPKTVKATKPEKTKTTATKGQEKETQAPKNKARTTKASTTKASTAKTGATKTSTAKTATSPKSRAKTAKDADVNALRTTAERDLVAVSAETVAIDTPLAEADVPAELRATAEPEALAMSASAEAASIDTPSATLAEAEVPAESRTTSAKPDASAVSSESAIDTPPTELIRDYTPAAPPQKASISTTLAVPVPDAPTLEATIDASSTSSTELDVAAPDTATEDKIEQARKSRRGRRGGRGRNKKPLAIHDAEITAETQDDNEEDLPKKFSLHGENAYPNENVLLNDETQEERGYDLPLRESFDEDVPEDADTLPQSDDDGISSVFEAEQEASKPPKPEKGKAIKAKPKSPAIKAKVQAMAGRRKMFISVVPGEQVEVVLSEEGAVHEYYLEMSHQAKFKGNIYKGIIHNIDANLQAAFVNYGAAKNGFLQIDEVHPEYYLTTHEPAKGKKFPPIQKVLKAGQEVLVQVVKEPAGSKGAFLTTWLSLAGRFLVLTPGQEQIGISRKVDNDEERGRLRELINGLDPGSGLGVIVRTVSAGTSKTTLKNDLMYLKRLWKDIRKRGTTETSPALIHEEPGLAARAVRDYLTDDVQEIWVDDEAVATSVRDMAGLLFPRKSNLVKVHNDDKHGMWERFNLQRQLEQIYAREVNLPSGGRLVFDQTEALMAIDINSGKISGKGNFEAMAFKTNLEAAEAIPRQLKLRDIGGQIVIDFIELRDKNNIREVEKILRNAMKNDRARNDVGRMSSFGLLEMVRQRTGSSALAISMEQCPCCKGTGLRRNMEWQSLQTLREISFKARNTGGDVLVYEAPPELGLYLLNHKRDRLREMEIQLGKLIEIRIK